MTTRVVEFPMRGGYVDAAVIGATVRRLRVIYASAERDLYGAAYAVTVLHAVGTLRFYSRVQRRVQRGPARVLPMRRRAS